jgi:hypothetical protein
MFLKLMHHTSQNAAGTEIATLTISVTFDGVEESYTYIPFTDVTQATFTSDEVLGFTMGTGLAGSAGVYDLIVRYKEK